MQFRICFPWKMFKYSLRKDQSKLNHRKPFLPHQFSSVQLLSHVHFLAIPWTAVPRLPCPSPTPGVYSNSCPLSQWCHPTISSSVIPFSTCLQSFLASGSFPMSQLFASGGQNIGVSALASVLSMNIQDWFPLGWTGLISLLPKGLSKDFSNTTVQNYQYLFNSLQQKCNPSCWVWMELREWQCLGARV